MSTNWKDELGRQVRRRCDPWVVLEGRHAVEAAIAGWWQVMGVLIAEECTWEPPMWAGLEAVREPRVELERVAGYPFHRGVLGLARQPEEVRAVAGLAAELAKERALVVVCPRLTDAANVGAIVRNAAALGAEAVFIGGEGVSPFDRKAVRASSGAVFRLPVRVADGGEILRSLKGAGFRLIGADGGAGATALDAAEVEDGPLALVVGAEAEGLSGFWKAACDERVAIPMESGMDSLNAAAASAVMLWELKRRRAERRREP